MLTKRKMDVKNSLISVIVPIYKVEQYLNECVQSIVDQTYRNLEIILVDDGSPDRCGEMCEEWQKRDNRIRVIHKQNGGLSDARNAGLDIAKGEYISFVDSDDWIEADMLEIMLSQIKQSEADICACGIKNYCNGCFESWNLKPLCGSAEVILKALYDDTAYPVCSQNKLYKNTIWESIRFPTGKLCEDAFTTYLLVDKAKKIVQIPDDLYCYRIREGSIMTTAFRPARMDEEEAWRKNYEYMALHYPGIKRKAFGFYLQKVDVLIHCIPKAQREEFQKEYSYLYGTLKKNWSFILFRSELSWKYRIRFVLNFMKLSPVKGV